jgi:hypothetical protein
LRALITADRDLVPDDKLGYRVAFLQAFRRRGIYPQLVSNLSPDSVCWSSPDIELPIKKVLDKLKFGWDLRINRREAYESSEANARIFWRWLQDDLTDEQCESLGFFRSAQSKEVNGKPGKLRRVEVHSVRPVRKLGPDNQQHLDVVVEITQSWVPDGGAGSLHRGGTTLIIDLERGRILYSISKRVANPTRVSAQQSFRMAMDEASLRSNYFADSFGVREPFAMLHTGE